MRVPALENKPSSIGYGWYWGSYIDLSSCRQLGMSAGPIPWTAIEQYAREQGLSTGEKYVFHRVIRGVDNKWLKLLKDEQDKRMQQSKSDRAKKTSSRRR